MMDIRVQKECLRMTVFKTDTHSSAAVITAIRILSLFLPYVPYVHSIRFLLLFAILARAFDMVTKEFAVLEKLRIFSYRELRLTSMIKRRHLLPE